jgi:Tol biopolymer transport system component
LPYYPDWRGDSIAFSAVSTGFRVALMRSDGSQDTVLPGSGARNDLAPRWVNDHVLVFGSNRASSYDIWYVDLAAGEFRRLGDLGGHELSPVPRPGTPGLAYCEAGATTLNGRIVLVPDTAAVPLERRYLTPDTLEAGEPDWNPAGTVVTFSAQDPDSTRHIWLATIGVTDTTLTKLTTGPFHDMSPRWSPDGSHIVFTSDRTGRSGVWVMSAAGESAGLRLISFDDTGATVATPCWSPDGNSLVVSSDGRGGQALWILRDLGL